MTNSLMKALTSDPETVNKLIQLEMGLTPVSSYRSMPRDIYWTEEKQRQKDEEERLYEEKRWEEIRKVENQNALNRLLAGESIVPTGSFIRSSTGKMYDYQGNLIDDSTTRAGQSPQERMEVSNALQRARGLGAIEPTQQNMDVLRKKIDPKYKPIIPIQSDKIQGAMAELGFNPADPRAYTNSNIKAANELLRKQKQEEGELLNAPERARIAHTLRTELRQDKFVQDYKDISNKFNVMKSAYNKAIQGKEKSFVAVDQALITLYNKMTDPSSVVRESEYARTPENMSIANRVLGKMDKWRQGGAGLKNDERTALMEMAQEFHDQYATNYDQLINDYEETAKESGLNPDLVIRPYRRQKDNNPAKSKEAELHNEMPDATKYNGKTMTDTDTGKRYRSNGAEWLPL